MEFFSSLVLRPLHSEIHTGITTTMERHSRSQLLTSNPFAHHIVHLATCRDDACAQGIQNQHLHTHAMTHTHTHTHALSMHVPTFHLSTLCNLPRMSTRTPRIETSKGQPVKNNYSGVRWFMLIVELIPALHNTLLMLPMLGSSGLMKTI